MISKVNKEDRKGGMVLLQEIHIKDEDLIKRHWKMNYFTSCVCTCSASVLTLFDNGKVL